MERVVRNIPEMYVEMMKLMKYSGDVERSRNGNVLALQEPLTITVNQPRERILVDPLRCANPFFHCLEFVWMMSGTNELGWIEQFNSRFVEYAEANGRIHGAYGYRWRGHFGIDQLAAAVEMLRDTEHNRRVVIGMWDPAADLGAQKNDLPCNTHIYLRVVDGCLDLTVCNRSNDVLWGMVGANAVHMTMLQELLAAAIGVGIGKYRVFTNNAHVYLDLPNVYLMLDTTTPIKNGDSQPVPLLGRGENWKDFLLDCEDFVAGCDPSRTLWMKTVAWPMYRTYIGRKAGEEGWGNWVDEIQCPAWENACRIWLNWKSK